MGSGSFFSKVASVDPLANALHLPGANKYAQQEANDANSTGAAGPYAGVTPTLAGANAGYAPGGPGSNPGYVPFHAQAPGGIFGFAQRASADAGAIAPNYSNGQASFTTPTAGAYNAAPQASPGAQAGMNPYVAAMPKPGAAPRMVSSNNLFGARQYGA